MLGQHAGAVVMNRMRALLTSLVRADLRPLLASKELRDLPPAAVVQYVVGSLLSVLTWWVDEKSTLGAEEVDSVFRRLTLPSIFQDE